MSRNPFNQLYVGEKVGPSEFVEIFSAELVPLVQPIFERGNVILSGVQGTGKSMLFKLLEPAIRIAYHEREIDFPVDPGARRFIAGGVNVNSARCNQFGRRRAPPGDAQHEFMFGDFVNHIVAKDLLDGLISLARTPALADDIGLDASAERLDELAGAMAEEATWQGAHKSVSCHSEFMDSL